MNQRIIKPLIIPVSVMALSGLLTNVLLAEKTAAIALSESSHDAVHRAKEEVTAAPKDIHIDIVSVTGDTYAMRTQPPAARPREDDEGEDNAKRRLIEGFGTTFSSTAT